MAANAADQVPNVTSSSTYYDGSYVISMDGVNSKGEKLTTPIPDKPTERNQYVAVTMLQNNGEPVFCLEPQIPAAVGDESKAYVSSNLTGFTSLLDGNTAVLTTDQEQKLSLIYYFAQHGSDGKTLADKDRYLAGQLMTWEAVGNKDLFNNLAFVAHDEEDGEAYLTAFNAEQVQKVKKEIEDKIAQYQGSPEFAQKTADLGATSPVTLTDTKSVLSAYAGTPVLTLNGVQVSPDQAEVKKEGNSFVVTPKKPLQIGTYKVSIPFFPDNTTYKDPIIMTKQGKQTLGYATLPAGMKKNTEAAFTVAAKNVSVQVLKHDAEDPATGGSKKMLSGATLGIMPGANGTLEAFNALKADISKKQNVDYWEISSTGDAKWTVQLPVNDAAAGTVYTLVELKAPAGYGMAEPIVFTVKNDGPNGSVTYTPVKGGAEETNTTPEVRMADAVVKHEVKISKLDVNTSHELAGAQMTLARGEVETAPQEAGDANFVTSWESKTEAHSVSLAEGTYTLFEIAAPNNYQTAEKIIFKVDADGNVLVKDTAPNAAADTWLKPAEAGHVVMKDAPTTNEFTFSKKWVGAASGEAVLKYEVLDDAPNYTSIWSKEVTLNADNQWTQKISVPKVFDGKYKQSFRLSEKRADGEWFNLDNQSANASVELANGKRYEATYLKNGSVYTVTNTLLTQVSLSKRDVGGGELVGARIELLEVNDQGTLEDVPLESWVSDGTSKVFVLGPGQYVFNETQAPEGYEVATRISFTVNEDGTVHVDNEGVGVDSAKNNLMVMVDDYKLRDVRVSKRALGQGEELPGARLSVSQTGDYAGAALAEGVKPFSAEWLSEGQAKVLELPAGTYTLVEDAAPTGYDKAESITFRVALDGKVQVKNAAGEYVDQADATVVMVDAPSAHAVRVSKKALGQGEELSGAKLSVTQTGDQNGAPLGGGVKAFVESWTSGGEAKELELPAGTYVLVEDQAPTGYNKAEAITFRVGLDGKVQVQGKDGQYVDRADATVTMVDAPEVVRVVLRKVWSGLAADSVRLRYSVLGQDSPWPVLWSKEVVLNAGNSWSASVDVPKWFDGKTSDRYRLEEKSGDGWVNLDTQPDTPVLMANGKSYRATYEGKGSYSFTVINTLYTDVTVSKQVLGQGTELKGAELSVSQTADQNGAPLGEGVKPFTDAWTSEGAARVLRLPAGTYTLVEDQAPVGYDKAEQITFRVTLDGKVQVQNGDEWQDAADATVTMEDALTLRDVTVSKQILGQGTELKGAKLSVSQTGDQNGAPLGEGVKPFTDAWTSEGEAKVLELPAGTYTLVEDAAPTGFDKAESITFRVTLDGKVQVQNGDGQFVDAKDATVTMLDALSLRDVTISKQILGQGSELAGAELSVSQTADQNGAALAEGVKPFTDAWMSESEARVLRLPAGTYTLVEDQAPLGYDKAEQITFRVTLDGKVQIQNGDEWQDAADVTVTMVDALSLRDVTISKQILGQGSELAGAELSVSQTADHNGAALGEGVKPFVESWTSEGEARVLRLPAGTYTLVEDQAPTGYDKAESITFRVTLDGKVQVQNGDGWQDAKDATVTMEDALTLRDVSISKQVLGQGSELAGAELSVSQTADQNGAALAEGVKPFATSWMSEGEARVLRLPAGTYTLVEDAAPTGYDKAESITFRVTLEGKVQVQGKDGWQDAAGAMVVMFDAPVSVPVPTPVPSGPAPSGSASPSVPVPSGSVTPMPSGSGVPSVSGSAVPSVSGQGGGSVLLDTGASASVLVVVAFVLLVLGGAVLLVRRRVQQ